MQNQNHSFAIPDAMREALSKLSHSKVFRFFRPPPMKKLSRAIIKTGFVERWDALELFARAGNWHTVDYKDLVNSLEAWEIDRCWEPELHQNLPGATVKITDTYAEIKTTGNKYNLVVSDNPMSMFAEGRHCEHFELFPDVFRILQDSSVLILNVIPSATRKWKYKFPYLLNEEHCRRRSSFYASNHPENISLEEMTTVYSRLASQNGFKIEKHIIVKRHIIYYLALFLVKVDHAAGC